MALSMRTARFRLTRWSDEHHESAVRFCGATDVRDFAALLVRMREARGGAGGACGGGSLRSRGGLPAVGEAAYTGAE